LAVQLDTTAEDRTAVRSAFAAMCATAQRSCAPRHEPPFRRSGTAEPSEKHRPGGQKVRRADCPTPP